MMTTLCAGLLLGLEADTGESLAMLRDAIGGASEVSANADFILSLGSAPRPNRAPDRHMQNVSWWDEGDELIIAAGHSSTARVRANRAVLDPGITGRAGVHQLLFPILSHAFANRGECVFHAGAFVVDSSAILVIGGSGQGKSTLVTAALRARWPVLSDDLVVLRLKADELHVAGVPQPLALPAEFSTEASVGAAIPDDHRGRRVQADATRSDTEWHPVGLVLLIQHSQQRLGELTFAAGRDVFHWALPSSYEGGTVGRAGHALPFAAAISRRPAWHLGHAADSELRLDAAINHVQQASRQAHAQRAAATGL